MAAIRRALSDGGAFLEKPLRPDELAATVRRVLDTSTSS
jgi:DNA-binding response OmpR family regulator